MLTTHRKLLKIKYQFIGTRYKKKRINQVSTHSKVL